MTAVGSATGAGPPQAANKKAMAAIKTDTNRVVFMGTPFKRRHLAGHPARERLRDTLTISFLVTFFNPPKLR
jgi:hypothetical protein